MKIGITIPNHWGVTHVHDVLALAVEAEQLGFDSIWTADHLLNTAKVRERLDDRPYWHPLSVLSAAAVMTSRVTLGTSVMVLPYHDPVGLAKYAATLDALSRGRFVLGVGAGGLREEFDALGVPFRRRGRITDECIAVMKDLWTSDEPSYRGGRFHFTDMRFSPRCVQRPHVPLWIGGGSVAAITRAARAGDGWHPTHITPQEFALGAASLRDQAREAGRDPAAIALAPRMDLDTTPPPDARSLAAIEAAAAGFRDAGAVHLLFAMTSGEVAGLREWMRALAGKLLPA
jgi:probable F420-dependent oxidoreductase